MASSSSKTSQNQTQVTQTSNLNLQDVTGGAVVGDGNTVLSTDHGAIETAGDIAGASLTVASDATRDALSFGEGALNLADRAGERQSTALADALSFGKSIVGGAFESIADNNADSLSFGKSVVGSAIDALTGSQSDALNFADRQNSRLADSNESSLQFAESLFMGAGDLLGSAYESAFDTAGDVLREGQAQVATTVSNLNAIARQSSTSDAERNQQIVKYALIAAAVMVVAFALRGVK